MERKHILNPWVVGEGISISEAVMVASRSENTLRKWCKVKNIGRRVADGHWVVSKPALDMLLSDDPEALAAYLTGERDGIVRPYFERVGLKHALQRVHPAKAA